MKLIPAVKDLQFHEGALHNRALKFPDQNVDPRIAALSSHFPTAEDGTPVYISAGPGNGESYRLHISEHQITIDAAGAADMPVAVIVVSDRNKSYTQKWKNMLQVITDLQIVSAKTGQILYNDTGDLP